MSSPDNPQPPLQEKNFIHEEYSRNPSPFWIWLLLLAVFMALLWGGRGWVQFEWTEQVEENPFLQVTNREMSLFLWQNPKHMRVHASTKSGYLPAFEAIGEVGLNPELADKFVVAPQNLLFLYHVWKRLVYDEFPQRPIPRADFEKFLQQVKEWQPDHWPNAPKAYQRLVEKIGSLTQSDLQTLPESTLPFEVRRAFYGWQNYFYEGEQINAVEPTYAQVEKFIQTYPHYARNFWRNIYPDYLKTASKGDQPVPKEEIAPFLRVALYNSLQTP